MKMKLVKILNCDRFLDSVFYYVIIISINLLTSLFFSSLCVKIGHDWLYKHEQISSQIVHCK